MPNPPDQAPWGVRLACSTACFRQTSIDVALEEIRALHFDTIDLAVIPGFCPHFHAAESNGKERDDFVQLVRNSGLAVATVTAVPGHFNIPGIDARFVVQAAVGNLKLAALLSARSLNVTGGLPIGDSGAFVDHAVAVAAGLKRTAQEAARLELNLNIEVLHPNSLCRTLDQAEFLLDRIAEPNTYILLGVNRVRDDHPERVVRRFAGRIGHVHLRDGGGADIAAAGGNANAGLGPLFEVLQQSGYRGYCALEVDGGANLEQGRRNLRNARRFVTTQAELLAGVCWPPPE